VGLGDGETLSAKSVVVATGYFDFTNRLDVPGEDLPHVSHFFDEPYAYAHSDVTVIGGRYSAVETALDLYHHGVRVNIVHRGPGLILRESERANWIYETLSRTRRRLLRPTSSSRRSVTGQTSRFCAQPG